MDACPFSAFLFIVLILSKIRFQVWWMVGLHFERNCRLIYTPIWLGPAAQQLVPTGHRFGSSPWKTLTLQGVGGKPSLLAPNFGLLKQAQQEPCCREESASIFFRSEIFYWIANGIESINPTHTKNEIKKPDNKNDFSGCSPLGLLHFNRFKCSKQQRSI